MAEFLPADLAAAVNAARGIASPPAPAPAEFRPERGRRDEAHVTVIPAGRPESKPRPADRAKRLPP